MENEMEALQEALDLSESFGAAMNYDYSFEKLYDDKYCDDQPPLPARIFTGRVQDYRGCKSKCISRADCQYMAYWVKLKKCETYSTCYTRKSDGKNKISIYRKVTMCEERLPEYVQEIVSSMPDGMFRYMHLPFEWEELKGMTPHSDYPNPNFSCKCIGVSWMTCVIVLSIGTEEDLAVRLKLGDTKKMKPFTILINDAGLYGAEQQYIVYKHSEMHATYAELQGIFLNPQSPTHANGCFHMRLCVEGTPGGVCPVSHKPFESGMVVYILIEEMHLINQKRPLPCLSVGGMRSWIVQDKHKDVIVWNFGFLDPLSREGRDSEGSKSILTIPDDYKMFSIYNDAALQTGICPPAISASVVDMINLSNEVDALDLKDEEEKSSPASSESKKRKSPKKKKKERFGVSPGAGPSNAMSPESFDLTQPEEHLGASQKNILSNAEVPVSSKNDETVVLFQPGISLFCFGVVLVAFVFAFYPTSSQQDIYLQFL